MSSFYDYLEEKWLSIAYEFRIVILVSIAVVLLMLVLYLYFFNVSVFGKLFYYCRHFRRPKTKKKRPRSKVRKEKQATKKEKRDSRLSKKENSRYCDKLDGERRSPKAEQPRARSFKAPPSVSISEIKSEKGRNSFANEDFNQQVKHKDDNLLDNINKYKNKLNSNIKLINRHGSVGKISATNASQPSLSAVLEPVPAVLPKNECPNEFNVIKVMKAGEDEPPGTEDPAAKESKMPKKIELGVKVAADTAYSGLSQNLEEARPEEPESKKTADDEKKHSAFSSFN